MVKLSQTLGDARHTHRVPGSLITRSADCSPLSTAPTCILPSVKGESKENLRTQRGPSHTPTTATATAPPTTTSLHSEAYQKQDDNKQLPRWIRQAESPSVHPRRNTMRFSTRTLSERRPLTRGMSSQGTQTKRQGSQNRLAQQVADKRWSMPTSPASAPSELHYNSTSGKGDASTETVQGSTDSPGYHLYPICIATTASRLLLRATASALQSASGVRHSPVVAGLMATAPAL